jgi:hypothetical protein
MPYAWKFCWIIILPKVGAISFMQFLMRDKNRVIKFSQKKEQVVKLLKISSGENLL